MKNKRDKIGKKVGLQISFLMGVTLSFFLSIAGGLLGASNSGRPFDVRGAVLSFVVSLIISLVIGIFVPMKKLTDMVGEKAGAEPGSLGRRCLDSLVSDIIYTPLITVLMVSMNWKMAMMHLPEGAHGPHFSRMLLSSLPVMFSVGFVLVFIFMPLYMKLVLKKNGLPVTGESPKGGPEKK
ncbi:MAG: hypothetical protein K6F53_06425 [Lachnospiraceae bacterium]|nr:hypothetical protein [Lachnospiraceae bacterium]